MKKFVVFIAVISAALCFTASCSRGVDSIKTLVDENNGHPIAVVVEYNTPISFLSVSKESFEIPGYFIISAMTTEKSPEEMLDDKEKKETAAPHQSGDKIQVVPRQGQTLNGEDIQKDQAIPQKGLTKDSFKGKDGKYVLLLVRKRPSHRDLEDQKDSTAMKPLPDPSAEVITVRQTSAIKTVKGKTIEAWEEGIASSETIKIKMRSRPGMPGGRRVIRRPGGMPTQMPSAPPSAPRK